MKKFLPAALLLLLGFTAFSVFITQGEQQAVSPTIDPQSEGKALIGGDFTLTNQDGAVVRDADFRGRVMLVFFGFTHCPDICPVTSATFAQLLTQLGDDANKIAPIFITVDPARDTPEVMKNYFANIDSRIIGLTGSPEDIAKVASTYKAYFSAPEAGGHGEHEDGHDEHSAHHDAGNYMVNHSGFVYLMDKNGHYVTHFAYDAPAETMAAEIKKLLN